MSFSSPSPSRQGLSRLSSCLGLGQVTALSEPQLPIQAPGSPPEDRLDHWTGGDGKHWHRHAHTGPDQVLWPAPLFRTLEDPQLTPGKSLVLTTWASPTSLPWTPGCWPFALLQSAMEASCLRTCTPTTVPLPGMCPLHCEAFPQLRRQPLAQQLSLYTLTCLTSSTALTTSPATASCTPYSLLHLLTISPARTLPPTPQGSMCEDDRVDTQQATRGRAGIWTQDSPKSTLILTTLQPQPLGNLRLFVFACWCCHTACGILLPGPGIEPEPQEVEAQSLPLDHQGSPWDLFSSDHLPVPLVTLCLSPPASYHCCPLRMRPRPP